MKHFKSLLVITAFIVLPLIGFSACSDKGDVNAPKQADFDSPQFALVDYTDITNGIEDASVDYEMTFDNTLFSYSFISTVGVMTPGNPKLMGNPWMTRFDFGKHLGLFFRGLNLTDAQKAKFKDLMIKYHETMKPLVRQFKDANAQIIAEANNARKAIAEQVKAGTLSRKEAAEQIKKLNEKTRAEIAANPATIDLKTQMCEARKQLLADVRGILEGAQVAKFDNLLKLIKNPC
ncbi:MAG: hypothetical protein CVV24_06830 [Ignavibacteriae bacterium HGW-Ignavibacteriae-3]|nr:MAG: hypothetical protein CVV24_06830 [Ignavibacteriae bacterium HGW-Ignavibacteriae-3]